MDATLWPMFERCSERVVPRFSAGVIAACALGLLCAGPAWGAETAGEGSDVDRGGLGVSFAQAGGAGSDGGGAGGSGGGSGGSLSEELGDGPRPAYRSRGSQALTVTGGFAYNFQDASDGRLGVAWSRFLEDDVEFMLEGGAWHFDQDGDNAAALSTSLLFRYHLLSYENWSFFGELGIGVMASTDRVPERGTSFNFLPRGGLGYTHRVSDRAHLIVGAHWHHISNARILGDTRNPGRDAPMLYAGFVFPF